MNEFTDINNDLNGVADYLNGLYNKQGGNLNRMGAKTIDKNTDRLSQIVNGIVSSLVKRSHGAIVTIINDADQEHDQDMMDSDRYSAIAHIESLMDVLHQLGIDPKNAQVARANVMDTVCDKDGSKMFTQALNEALKKIDGYK